MKGLQIFSRDKLAQIIALGDKHYNCCISIGDKEDRLEEICDKFDHVLRLKFDDIIEKNEFQKRLPKKSHIRKVVRFYNKTKDLADGYTIHCYAGVHRSVAVGLILLYLMTGSESEAKEKLLKIKGLPLPNKRMIDIFDHMFKTNLKKESDELWQRGLDFMSDKIKINIDDYLEELEVIDE